VFGSSRASGIKLKIVVLPLTLPEIAPLEFETRKLELLIVDGAMDSLNCTVTILLVATPVIPSGGFTPTMYGT
jgi:hypothetical protein